jgi:hypothetical protein
MHLATCTAAAAEAKFAHTPLAAATPTATAADIKLGGMAGAEDLKRSSNHVDYHAHTLSREISTRARRTHAYTGTYKIYNLLSEVFETAPCSSCPDNQIAYQISFVSQQLTACGNYDGACAAACLQWRD